MTNPSADSALAAFLEAASEEAAREALGVLLATHGAPLVGSIVRNRLRRETALHQGVDVEDVAAGAVLRLTEHLWSMRRDRTSIHDFSAYVAVLAHNACHGFLRRRFPERSRLRTRLRYLLTHEEHLALWQDEGQEWLCGSAATREKGASPEAAAWLAGARTQTRGRPGAAAFADLVRSLLAECPGPFRLEDLVDSLAAMLGVQDGHPREHLRDVEAAASQAPGPADSMQQNQWLSRLWSEIQALPRPQCCALLLNLRDPDDRGMIEHFPLTGTASKDEIARVLDVGKEEFSRLWDSLPRDDQWIAEFLGITRRQVINLRKCARERLARRMRAAAALPAVTSTPLSPLNKERASLLRVKTK